MWTQREWEQKHFEVPTHITEYDYMLITQLRGDLVVVVKLVQQILESDDPKAKAAELLEDLMQPAPPAGDALQSQRAQYKRNEGVYRWLYREWEKWIESVKIDAK
jgi:preprotein translocase subunit SecA